MAISTIKFEHQKTVLADTEHVILIPSSMINTSIAVHPENGGSANIYISLSPINDIKNSELSVKWIEWDTGSVTDPTADGVRTSINAVKLVVTGADCVFEVLAR